MEAATLPQQQDGAPVEGAEATRTVAHLFQYSARIHVGAGAEECEHGDDGTCKDRAHFHAWIGVPNGLQRRDILEKAKAAKARRRRSLRDPVTDAYAILEADLDDLLAQDRKPILEEVAAREVRKGSIERITGLIEGDERFENYWQDAEEWRRLSAMAEEDRPEEADFAALDAEMTAFEGELDRLREEAIATEVASLEGQSTEELRETLREVRIEGDSSEAHMRTYRLWMGFISTRQPLADFKASKRIFESIEDYRNAAPEIVDAIDETLRELEGRQERGDAAGN